MCQAQATRNISRLCHVSLAWVAMSPSHRNLLAIRYQECFLFCSQATRFFYRSCQASLDMDRWWSRSRNQLGNPEIGCALSWWLTWSLFPHSRSPNHLWIIEALRGYCRKEWHFLHPPSLSSRAQVLLASQADVSIGQEPRANDNYPRSLSGFHAWGR